MHHVAGSEAGRAGLENGVVRMFGQQAGLGLHPGGIQVRTWFMLSADRPSCWSEGRLTLFSQHHAVGDKPFCADHAASRRCCQPCQRTCKLHGDPVTDCPAAFGEQSIDYMGS